MQEFYYSNNKQEMIDAVEAEVCKVFKISKEDLANRSRSPRFTHARFALWYVLHKVKKLSSMEISRKYGYDHSTILNGVLQAIHMGVDTQFRGQLVERTRKAVDSPINGGDKKRG